MPPTSPLALPFLSSTLIKLICMEYLRVRTVERGVRARGGTSGRATFGLTELLANHPALACTIPDRDVAGCFVRHLAGLRSGHHHRDVLIERLQRSENKWRQLSVFRLVTRRTTFSCLARRALNAPGHAPGVQCARPPFRPHFPFWRLFPVLALIRLPSERGRQATAGRGCPCSSGR